MIQLRRSAWRVPGADGVHPSPRFLAAQHPLSPRLADERSRKRFLTPFSRTIIPPTIGRPTDKPPTGYYRRLMRQRLHLTSYGQRWQAETVLSMVKRRTGSALGAPTYWSQCRALLLKAITHNILILYALTERRTPMAMVA